MMGGEEKCEVENNKSGVWKWVATGTVTLLAIVFAAWIRSVDSEVAAMDKQCKERHGQDQQTIGQVQGDIRELQAEVRNVKDQGKDTNERVRRIENILLERNR